jgi:hypothetical protein
MRLVITFISAKYFSDDDINAFLIELDKYFNVKKETYRFSYPEFFELDIDLININFSKETIYFNLLDIIHVCENILSKIRNDIEFIIADIDTGIFVDDYKEDRNNIGDFGIFVTKRSIPNEDKFYSSEICNAYVNLVTNSFGLYYD